MRDLLHAQSSLPRSFGQGGPDSIDPADRLPVTEIRQWAADIMARWELRCVEEQEQAAITLDLRMWGRKLGLEYMTGRGKSQYIYTGAEITIEGVFWIGGTNQGEFSVIGSRPAPPLAWLPVDLSVDTLAYLRDALKSARTSEFLVALTCLRGDVAPLCVMLEGKNLYARAEAVEALVSVGDEQAVGPLVRVLREPGDKTSPGVGRRTREKAAEALGRIGDARAIEPLVRVLQDPNNAGILGQGLRVKTAEALGRIGDARAVEPLAAALADEHFLVAKAAAEALGEIGDERAVPALLGVVNHRDGGLANKACEAIEKIGCVSPPLVGALASPDAGLRASAAGLLERIDPQWATREGALAAAPELLAGLLSKDPEVCLAADEVLGRLDPRWTKSDAARKAQPALIQRYLITDGVLQSVYERALNNISQSTNVRSTTSTPRGIRPRRLARQYLA
ncbi:MAG: hypothetical protein AMS14_09490 [Planctomycetes bacterium DG_20]|nr:MAG: hypothetical protein AMS14_09490 [Planctomycetes bacterium DG_20]